MAINIAPKTLDTELSLLLKEVECGKAQLPEFQRSWTWDDNRIIGILASLSLGYPMGAIMRLTYGNDNIRFKCRYIEGVDCLKKDPDYLVLDGQQRLTSMFRATHCAKPVDTKNDKGKELKRFYYLDINKCLDENEDREDAVLSIPEDRKIKENFDRDVVLDISTRELEYEHEMFPLNIVFDSSAREDWSDGYKEHYHYQKEYLEKYKKFRTLVLETIIGYKLPVITLDKETPREAVCKVFENVNTGGVPLTVFELVTATFATYNFDLREDWEKCKDIIRGKDEKGTAISDVMFGVDETAFLTAITLYTTYHAPTMTTCKKKDVLALSYKDYCANKDKVLAGYKLARNFLYKQYVFRMRDLPYTTQLIPLAAVCAEIGKSLYDQPSTQAILSKWFWCGILGEMYGGANETRYANDMEDLVASIKGEKSLDRTINNSFFSSTRLLSLQTRNSAAYKGIMALIYRAHSNDFVQGTTIDIVKSMDESPDIHHIFPEAYCEKMQFKKEKWNSIVNKTPLLPESNRQIGGEAPSSYSKKVMQKAEISEDEYRKRIESHLINYDYFINDDFDNYFIDRAKRILNEIERAMGKVISDKNSEQTINLFGTRLGEQQDSESQNNSQE